MLAVRDVVSVPYMNGDGILEETYERLHRTRPEFEGWLSNHGPMAMEAMVRRGQGRRVHRWLDGVRRLEELPRGTAAIDDWRTALGEPRRLGDWLAFFAREVAERPWRDVLETWWPRLLPGIAAGATHGVIRTGHAVNALLEHEDAPRRAELGQALGYWAARWQPVPAAVPSGTVGPAAALPGVPRVPDQEGGIIRRLAQIPGLAGWTSALAALRPPRKPSWPPGKVTGAVPRRSATATAERPVITFPDSAPTPMTTRVDAARIASKSCR